MGAFVAAEAVSGLDFKLDPWGPAGVIPEPSTGQIEKLTEALSKIAGDTGADTADAALAQVAKLPEDEQAAMLDGIMGAITDITQTVLTREQIDALPHRIKNAFLGWLLGSLLLPEALSPATTV